MKGIPPLRSLAQRISVVYRVGILGLLGGNFAALLLIRQPSKVVEYPQVQHLPLADCQGGGVADVPVPRIISVYPPQLDVTILPTHSGYLDLLESAYTKDLVYLAMLARVLSPKVVFEIGTFEGYSALLFALNTPADTMVYTLDLPKNGNSAPLFATTVIDDAHIAGHQTFAAYLYEGHPCSQKIKQLYGDSAKFDFAPWHEKVDLFFIDGAHSFEYVRSDTLKALKCCRPGSIIAWHDYGRWGVNGVSRWLHALAKERAVHRLSGSSLALMKV